MSGRAPCKQAPRQYCQAPFNLVTIPFRVANYMIGGSGIGNGARMVFLRSFGMGRRSDVLIYDPHKLSSPQVFLLTMVIFLAIVAFIAAILTRQISTAFVTNPGLNGLIVGVLAVGILLAFVQVGRLFR